MLRFQGSIHHILVGCYSKTIIALLYRHIFSLNKMINFVWRPVMEEHFVKKILLMGNGFDLAHGLLTKYNNVMELFKNWELFYDSHKKRSLEN